MCKRPCCKLRLASTRTKPEATQQKAQCTVRTPAAFWLPVRYHSLKEPWAAYELSEVVSQEVTRVGQVVFTRLMQIRNQCQYQSWGHSVRDTGYT